MKTKNMLALVTACLTWSCGRPAGSSHVEEIWNKANDPLLLQGDFTRQFAKLPLTGELPETPWTDTYWPSNLGGIAQRWRHAPPDQFSYKTYSEAAVAKLSLAQLADLSPAEKYDIYEGRFDYPTVARERARVSAKNAYWEGICHGWAPAALNFAEPKPIKLAGASGIQVPFASSDIKALLSYYQGELSAAPSRMLGTRCNIDLAKFPNAAKTHPECKGINAGAFHVALVNLVGRGVKGFVADVSHGNEIWNQPVYGFRSKVETERAPSPGAAPEATSEVVINTEMDYTKEIDPTWAAVNGTDDWSGETVMYRYTVELNARGNIIGGAWLSTELLDFVWTQERPEFSGYFADVLKVYERAKDTRTVLAEPK